jgi:SHS2 domain-containing protein
MEGEMPVHPAAGAAQGGTTGQGAFHLTATHEFLEHTSEVALRINADSFGSVIEEAGRALAELQLPGGWSAAEPEWVEIDLHAADRGAMLVDWLNELLFRSDRDRWVAVEFQVKRATDTHLRVLARGVRVDDAPAIVKAATLHGVRVEPAPEGMEAHVILDI